MKCFKLFLVTVLFLSIRAGVADESSDTFVVRVFGTKIRVISPMKYSENLSVIVENKSYSNILGKVITKKGRLIGFVSVPAEKFKVVALKNLKKDEELYFVPLAPAFQEVELVIGKEVYEIPPQRRHQ